MIYTNKQNIPEPLANAVSVRRRPVAGRISVTQLIGPPQIRQLVDRNWDNLKVDVSDEIWAIFGSIVHKILEDYHSVHHLSEEKLTMQVGDWVVSGVPDLLDEDGTLTDYKFTSVWSYVLGDPIDWQRQLNCYAALYRHIGFEVRRARIQFLLRNWEASRAERESDYPQHPVPSIEVDLWDQSKTLDYINSRVNLHKEACNMEGSEELAFLFPCSPAERWARPDKWAVKKKGNKKALPYGLHESEANAQKFATIKEKEFPVEIEYRRGQNIRCERYCVVRDFCQQWKDMNDG